MDPCKMIALKTVIKDFVTIQFMQNGVTHEEGALIMDGVNSFFQQAALESVIHGMIQKPQEVQNGNINDHEDT